MCQDCTLQAHRRSGTACRGGQHSRRTVSRGCVNMHMCIFTTPQNTHLNKTAVSHHSSTSRAIRLHPTEQPWISVSRMIGSYRGELYRKVRNISEYTRSTVAHHCQRRAKRAACREQQSCRAGRHNNWGPAMMWQMLSRPVSHPRGSTRLPAPVGTARF